ncbi:MAG TPA: hypothetical protein VGS00_06135 [Thermoanaerobaculia bacterium]|nr:hypothetical protein [Thermoanaerobaculia bacterium]
MARGWGRSEEDLGAEREQAREAKGVPAGGSAPSDAAIAGKRRSLELSLARIEDLLAKTSNAARRDALESARAEIRERLEGLGRQKGGGGL